MDHGTTEIRIHVQRVLASIFTTKKIIKEVPGNRLTKHTELRWAVFGILIAHMHDRKPHVMMDSI